MKKLIIFTLISLTQFNFCGELRKRSLSESDLSNLAKELKYFTSQAEKEKQDKKFCYCFCKSLGCLYKKFVKVIKAMEVDRIQEHDQRHLEIMRFIENRDC